MSDARITPQVYIDYCAKKRGITVGEIGIAPLVVVSWWQGVITSMAEEVGATKCDNWVSSRSMLYSLQSSALRISFLNLPVCAAASVMTMEELIACGAKKFIALGWAGSLQQELPIGSLIMPTVCTSEEGTSKHYVNDTVDLVPDEELKSYILATARDKGIEITTGHHWTTDAPYRELNSKIEAYRKQGVLGVDMETSAMYALGIYRDVSVCNVLVISDELWHDWNPAFESDEVRKGTRRAQSLILNCAENLLC